MKALKKTLIAAGVGALVAVMGAGSASASPITFTWNPSLTSGGVLSTGGAFTANNIFVSDYATLNVGNPAAISEHSILAVNNFNSGVSPAGFVNGNGQPSGANPGGTPYQLYFVIDSVSHVTTPIDANNFLGKFDSLSYTLYGDKGGNCMFSPSFTGAANCSGDQQFALATGGLSNNGLNQANVLGGIPSANADATIITGPNAGGFFVSPADLTSLLFEAAFTNTPGVVTRSGNIITINGGGGNVDVVVPEPLTLSLFGAGLVGAAALRRRRSKKA
jgi:hypothetical protein